MLELIVVRHGETIENIKGICQGQTHGTLSENGVRQNKILAKELSGFQIHKIYSSPLKRAFETAKEIHQYHKVELELKENLAEFYLGDLQGEKFPKNFDITNLSEEKESIELVRNRLLVLLKDVYIQHQNETILFVSHGLTLKVLTSILQNIPFEIINKMDHLKNSTYKKFVIKKI